jgi:hypothetical protein
MPVYYSARSVVRYSTSSPSLLWINTTKKSAIATPTESLKNRDPLARY